MPVLFPSCKSASPRYRHIVLQEGFFFFDDIQAVVLHRLAMNCSSISLCLCLSQVAHVDLTNAVAHPRGSRAVGDFNIITPFHEVKSYAHLWSVFLFLKKYYFSC